MTEIRFYRANEKPYGMFSNLFKREIEFEGEVFQTAEHAYQAGKAAKPEVRKWLMDAPSPSLLAMAAHGLYVWDITPNWAKIKFDRMKRILVAKYTQHDDLKALLLDTGDARLVESATVDNAVNRLWGEVNGVGQNKLGQLLMEVRSELAQLEATTKPKASRKKVSKTNTPTTATKAETPPATRRRAAVAAASN
ncbi:MAG: NADAR family protein [Pseudomonadota bacterium]